MKKEKNRSIGKKTEKNINITENGQKMNRKWTENGQKMDRKWTDNGQKMKLIERKVGKIQKTLN